jgi:choline dehydrogenase-like flavoprotein
MGAEGWSYSDVLPYFKRTEAAEDGESDTRGGFGPVGVQWTRAKDPISRAWIEAAKQLGFRENVDPARGDTEGIGLSQYTIRNGRRSSAAVAYLRPARSRPNLTVRNRVHVNRVIIENGEAIGVNYSDRNGGDVNVMADREVILSAGVFNTPQLLMLSGVGPADHLREHTIKVVADLPVGQNLQDHLMTSILYARKSPGEFHHNMRIDRVVINMMRSYFTGKGYASSLPGGVIAFLKSHGATDVPDIQLMFPTAPFHARVWFPVVRRAYEDAFLVRPAILHPQSRGEVKLRSIDPRSPVSINFNFFSAENDLPTLRSAFRVGREIAQQKVLDSFRGREISPGEGVQTDAEIDAYLRKSSVTISHPSCTCPMGVGPDAVLDPSLKVLGVKNLRVVDASAMPDIVSAPINACVLMMAEKASDIIRGQGAH